MYTNLPPIFIEKPDIVWNLAYRKKSTRVIVSSKHITTLHERYAELQEKNRWNKVSEVNICKTFCE